MRSDYLSGFEMKKTEELKIGSDTGNEMSQIEGVSKEELAVKIALAPCGRAWVTNKDYLKNLHADIDMVELLQELNRQSRLMVSDDNEMDQCQLILASQAITLDTIFHSLAHRSHNQEYLRQYETYMKLALKAQAQSRCTIETISKIKNPPNATFVKQANIAQGYQQVNNGVKSDTRTGKTENPPNELLEDEHGQWLDTRTPSTTRGDDTNMETVETINRAEDISR